MFLSWFTATGMENEQYSTATTTVLIPQEYKRKEVRCRWYMFPVFLTYCTPNPPDLLKTYFDLFFDLF